MGLKSSGSYFQHQIATAVGSLLHNGVEIYLDDLIVYVDTEEEYLNNLERMLLRIKEFNASLSPKKCKFDLREIEFISQSYHRLW